MSLLRGMMFFKRVEGVNRAKIAKAMEDAFAEPQTDAERNVKVLIDQFLAVHPPKLSLEVFRPNWSPEPAHGGAVLEKDKVCH